MKTTNFPGQVEKRQREATKRRETWSQLTPKQQLDALDARLGTGEGAKRQREKLVKMMSLTLMSALFSLTMIGCGTAVVAGVLKYFGVFS